MKKYLVALIILLVLVSGCSQTSSKMVDAQKQTLELKVMQDGQLNDESKPFSEINPNDVVVITSKDGGKGVALADGRTYAIE